MMCMGGSEMLIGILLSTVLVLGFAYIVWILAIKESGNIKVIGQMIAAVLAVLVLVMLLYGVYGGMTGKGGKCGACMMDGKMMDGKMMDNGKMMGK